MEQYSEHPLGKAILKSYQKKEEAKLIPIKEFQMLAGQGVQAVIGMDSIIIGNKKLLENRKITISDEIKQATKKYLSKGCTVVFVAQKERLVGYLIYIRYREKRKCFDDTAIKATACGTCTSYRR